jgi:2-polyprenyl-3-methyl-5-hydroxy-6-metoxy-1,4-benzoquinol methylase
VFAIALGEGLGYIPRGTHAWAKFVRPAELDGYAEAAGLQAVRRVGEGLDLWPTLRRGVVALRPTRSLAVAYAALFRRCP